MPRIRVHPWPKYSSQTRAHGCSKTEDRNPIPRRLVMSQTIWNRYVIALAAPTTLALLLWIAGAKPAQEPVTGNWTAFLSKQNSKLHLEVERRTEPGGRSHNVQKYK